MVIICVIGSYVDGSCGYSRARPPRCSTPIPPAFVGVSIAAKDEMRSVGVFC